MTNNEEEILEKMRQRIKDGHGNVNDDFFIPIIDELKEEIKQFFDLVSENDRLGAKLKEAYRMAVEINVREITHERFEPLLELLTPDDQK